MTMNDVTVRRQEACDLLGSLQEGSVPLIIADPPYGIAYHSNRYQEKNPHAPVAQDWNFQIGPFLRVAGRVLAEGGVLYLFSRWDVYPLWVAQVAPPLQLKNVIVWVKDNHSAGDLTGDFGNRYEQIMMLTKGRHLLRGHRWSNVWDFARVPARKLLHPTQKPTALLERIIQASTDEHDLVVDPFCGSGSTGEAARSCGRKALLGDIDPKMVLTASRRLGLPDPASMDEPVEVNLPACPIFQVTPPEPSLWGLHPEDLAYACLKEPVPSDLSAGLPEE